MFLTTRLLTGYRAIALDLPGPGALSSSVKKEDFLKDFMTQVDAGNFLILLLILNSLLSTCRNMKLVLAVNWFIIHNVDSSVLQKKCCCMNVSFTCLLYFYHDYIFTMPLIIFIQSKSTIWFVLISADYSTQVTLIINRVLFSFYIANLIFSAVKFPL